MSRSIFGRTGHNYLSKKKGFIPPNVNYANLDKITLEIQTAYIIHAVNEEEYHLLITRLARFRHHFSGSFRNAFKFNQRQRLYGGELTVHRHYQDQHLYGQSPIRIRLRLHLNLSRAAHHVRHNAPASEHSFRSFMRDNEPLIALQKHDAPPIAGIRNALMQGRLTTSAMTTGLDGQDNVMDLDTLFDLRPVRTAFPIYLDSVLADIRDVLEAVTEGRVVEVMGGWSLTETECYWEYVTPDAISLVRWLQDGLPQLFSNASIAEYIYDAGLRERRGQRSPTRQRNINCPAITLGLGNKSISLIIYAKLLDRIRFEVRFHSNLKQLLRVRSDTDMRRGIRTLIDKAIVRSHGYLKRTFKHISKEDMPEKMEVIAFTQFLGAIAQASYRWSPETFTALFPLLLTTGGVTVKKSSVQHRVCKSLSSENILKLTKAGRAEKNMLRYVILPEYRKVLEVMLGTVTMPRVRERANPRRRPNRP